METLCFSSKKKEELIDITSDVIRLIRGSRVKEGICAIFVPHATAALFICQKFSAFLSTIRTHLKSVLTNEYEAGLKEDFLNSLSFMVPNHLPMKQEGVHGKPFTTGSGTGYSHDQLDGNATSHIKAALVGPSLTLTIHEGKPVLGTWQQIFLCEFDGPRSTRKVTLQVVGS